MVQLQRDRQKWPDGESPRLFSPHGCRDGYAFSTFGVFLLSRPRARTRRGCTFLDGIPIDARATPVFRSVDALVSAGGCRG